MPIFYHVREKKQKSISKKGAGSLFETTSGTTISTREVSKVRANEFTKLKAGQFAFLSDGKNEMIKFNRLPIEKELINYPLNSNDSRFLENYDKIIREVKSIVKQY